MSGQSMFSWNVFLKGLALLQCFLSNSVEPRFSMGCNCGIRKLDPDSEADCEESAKLEAPEAKKTSIIKADNHHFDKLNCYSIAQLNENVIFY